MKSEIKVTNNVNDILFPVRMEDTENVFNISANSDYAKTVVATIDGQDKILNVCSDRYELVPNDQIFPAIRHELNSRGVKFSETYRNTNNAIFNASYTLEDNSFKVGTANDVIKPKFEVTHSYNGQQKYSIVLGYFRLICSNGLVIPLEGKEDTTLQITGKHTQKILDSIGQLFDMIPQFLKENGGFIKKYEVLFDTKVDNFSDRVEEVMNATGIKKGMDDVLATIRTEMSQLNIDKPNDWLVYNAINRLIYDDEKNVKLQAVRRDLDKKVLAHIMQG